MPAPLEKAVARQRQKTSIANCALRYNWLLLKPLVLHVLDSVLQDFDAESKVEVSYTCFTVSGHIFSIHMLTQLSVVPDWATTSTCR